MKDDSHKRFSDLIKAFAFFSEGKSDVRLLMVGGNEEYLAKYRLLAEELHVTDKILFVGYQSDVTLFYQMMDVFALVSAREAFGLVLAEAMLNKLPVIATRVGGMKYIVEDQVTGFLVEIGDIEAMSDHFERLYNDTNLKDDFGKNGYKRAVHRYTEEQYIKRISNLYMELFKK